MSTWSLLCRVGGKVEFARVTKRLHDKDGLPIRTVNDNPILDSRMYEVEFPDGHKTSMAANVIAENLFAQVDPEGIGLRCLKTLLTIAQTGSKSPLKMP